MKHLAPEGSDEGYYFEGHGRTEKQRCLSITCDVCNATFDDIMELQEFQCLKDVGGYGNRWVGDLNRWEIDICQDCQSNMFGNYVRVTPYG